MSGAGQHYAVCLIADIKECLEFKTVGGIAVELRPPLEALHDMEMEAGMYSGYPMNHVMIRFRKPAHTWGWDILPRLPLGGIFRNIRLVCFTLSFGYYFGRARPPSREQNGRRGQKSGNREKRSIRSVRETP